MAVAYTGLGDNEQAFSWLDKAFEQREWWLLLLKTNPVFDKLRADPRYADLLRRMNLNP